MEYFLRMWEALDFTSTRWEKKAIGKALGKVGTGTPKAQRAHSMLEEDLEAACCLGDCGIKEPGPRCSFLRA